MQGDIATILIAFLAAANCGLLGSFLMLRGQAMIGDAISHALLPGIVVAFIIGNTTHPLLMLTGATFASILVTLWITFLKEKTKITQEAAIGISFTSFFALGLVLIALYTERVDLDQGCVLYGELASAHFATWTWQGIAMGPTAVYILMGLLLLNTTFIVTCYNPLLITSFDKNFAQVIGIHTKRREQVFFFLIAINVVFVFRIVGAPLVLGFLILPPATAFLFANRLVSLLFYTVLIDLIITLHGYWLALTLNSSLAGVMVTIAGILFGFVVMFTRYTRAKLNTKSRDSR